MHRLTGARGHMDQPRLPDFDEDSDANRFVWILVTSQAIRSSQATRLAEQIARIERKAHTHGNQQDQDRG